ncbi:MAG: DUF481 domain-containing protein [Bacteroidota bacterium]
MLQRYRLLAILCWLALFPLWLSAQTDESDTLKWKAGLDVTGFWQSGNVDTWIFRSVLDVQTKPSKTMVFRTKNSYLYQAFGKEKADQDILSLNFLNFGPERKFSPFVLAFVSSNFRRQIDLRYLLGAGVTYQIYKKDKNFLKMSLSSEYERTDFNANNYNVSEYDGVGMIETMRMTIWANGKYYLFDEKMIFRHESFFQPSLESGNNFRWQFDVGLELPIKKSISFKISYLQTHESIVIEDQDREDRFLTFGLSLKNH